MPNIYQRDQDYQRKSPCLAVMPSTKVKLPLFNSNPQIKYYNVHDPSYLTDNTEEDSEDNEDQSVIEHNDNDSDYKYPDDTSQD
eukprot:840320-Ditylum_brightwellii.AAC.1